MSEGHFGLAGAYREDPTVASQRAHREREAQLDRQERCERWITARMAGRTFDSLDALQSAARGLVVTLYGRPLAVDEATLIERACVALWAGLVDHRYFAGRILVTRGERIRFLGAA